MNRKYLFVVMTLTTVLHSCDPRQERTKLLLNPPLHGVYDYSLLQATTSKWTYENIPYAKNDTISLRFSMENVHDSAGIIVFRLLLKRFRWNDKVDFSRNAFESMPLLLTVARTGQVLQINNANEIYRDVVQDSGTRPEIKGLLSDYLSSSGLTDLFNRMFWGLPSGTVKENVPWSRAMLTTTNVPVKFDNLYQLQKVNGDTALINIESIVSDGQLPEDVSHLNGTQKGVSKVNMDTGMPYLYDVGSETVTKMTEYDFAEQEHLLLKLQGKQPLNQ